MWHRILIVVVALVIPVSVMAQGPCADFAAILANTSARLEADTSVALAHLDDSEEARARACGKVLRDATRFLSGAGAAMLGAGCPVPESVRDSISKIETLTRALKNECVSEGPRR